MAKRAKKRIDAEQHDKPEKVDIQVHTGKEAERHKAEMAARATREEPAQAVADILPNAAKVARAGNAHSLEGKVSTSAPKARVILGGVGAILLALVSGSALSWFALTQLFSAASPLLAQLPASTAGVIVVDQGVSYEQLTELLPEDVRSNIERAAVDYDLEQDELQAVTSSSGAFGVVQQNDALVPFALLPKTEVLEELAGRLQEYATKNMLEQGQVIYERPSEAGHTDVVWAELETTFVVTQSKEVLQQFARVTDGTEVSLAQNESIQTALRHLPVGGATVVWDTQSSLALADVLPMPVGLEAHQQKDPIVGSVRLAEEGMQFTIATAQKRSSRASGGELLSFVPESATFAVQASDLSRVFQQTDLFSLQEESTHLASGITALETFAGTPIKEGVLDALDGATLLVAATSSEGVATYAIASELHEEHKTELVARLEEEVVAYYGRSYPIEQEFILDDGTSATELVPDLDRFAFSDAKDQNVSLRVLQDPAGQGGVSHAHVGNIWIVSTSETLLREMLTTTESEQLTRVRGALRGEAAGSDALYAEMDGQFGVFSALALSERAVRTGTIWGGVLYWDDPLVP